MPTTEPTPEPVDFEQALLQLESIVQRLEDGSRGLTQALGDYEQGIRLLQQCHHLLARAERRIEQLTGLDAAGNPVTVPFDDQPTADEPAKGGGRSRKRTAKPTPANPDEGNTMDERRGLF